MNDTHGYNKNAEFVGRMFKHRPQNSAFTVTMIMLQVYDSIKLSVS
jgi:hypothetical protein